MTWGVYVHVPWCRHQCPYCHFYVRTDTPRGPELVDRALAEFAARRSGFPEEPPTTLFLGGGTPSRLDPSDLGRLVRGIAPTGEVSAEANPEDVDDAWLSGAIAAGITRLSLGVQSFDKRTAGLLSRAATVKQSRGTVARVAESGLASWSVDLIFAVPGQTLDDLDRDLDDLLGWDPPHVSLYGLTIEPDTPFERLRDRGTLVPTDPDLWRAMYERIVARLGAAGLRRYEVSNFARPGHESAHNTLYWTDRPYMGLGPSAHGYAPDGSRWVNRADATAYLEGADPTESLERPSPEQAATDLLISALRHRDGVEVAHLAARTGHAVDARTLRDLAHQRLIEVQSGRIALAPDGYPVSDAVIRLLASRLHPC